MRARGEEQDRPTLGGPVARAHHSAVREAEVVEAPARPPTRIRAPDRAPLPAEAGTVQLLAGDPAAQGGAAAAAAARLAECGGRDRPGAAGAEVVGGEPVAGRQ